MQTSIPSPYLGTLDGIRKITAAEGVGGLYKGLYPLWGRQIPYTMVSEVQGCALLSLFWRISEANIPFYFGSSTRACSCTFRKPLLVGFKGVEG
jgi:hypothetical protein